MGEGIEGVCGYQILSLSLVIHRMIFWHSVAYVHVLLGCGATLVMPAIHSRKAENIGHFLIKKSYIL